MRRGYTIFELMVTILVVTALAAVVGAFFVNLLTIQERDREEAYIRETLADMCANYADFTSLGSAFSIANLANIVSFRQETGGLSCETGRVSHVAYLATATTNSTMDLNFYSLSTNSSKTCRIFSNLKNGLVSNWARKLNGDASLLDLPTSKLDVRSVICTLTPLGVKESDAGYVSDSKFIGFNVYSNAAFGNLKIEAWYTYRNSRRESVLTNAVVERLVRLWNHE